MKTHHLAANLNLFLTSSVSQSLPKGYIMHCLVTDKEKSDAPVQIYIYIFFFSFRLTIFFLQLFGEAPELFKNALNAVGSSPNIKCSLIIRKKKKRIGMCLLFRPHSSQQQLTPFLRFRLWTKKMKTMIYV